LTGNQWRRVEIHKVSRSVIRNLRIMLSTQHSVDVPMEENSTAQLFNSDSYWNLSKDTSFFNLCIASRNGSEEEEFQEEPFQTARSKTEDSLLNELEQNIYALQDADVKTAATILQTLQQNVGALKRLRNKNSSLTSGPVAVDSKSGASRREFREKVGREVYKDILAGSMCYQEIIQKYKALYPEHSHRFTENFCSKLRCGRIMNRITGVTKRTDKSHSGVAGGQPGTTLQVPKMRRVTKKSPLKAWSKMTPELFGRIIDYEQVHGQSDKGDSKRLQPFSKQISLQETETPFFFF